jgi:hypothetical protein
MKTPPSESARLDNGEQESLESCPISNTGKGTMVFDSAIKPPPLEVGEPRRRGITAWDFGKKINVAIHPTDKRLRSSVLLKALSAIKTPLATAFCDRIPILR